MTTAVIFVPAEQLASHADTCLTYCAARGYHVAGIVSGDWDAAADMLKAGHAGVMVVARPDHLDARREPRIEVVAENDDPAGHRRTRVIRRGAAA